MTFDEVLAATADRKIVRHQSKVFFCVYSAEDAERFASLGAYVRPAGGHGTEWGQPCWEVYLREMLDPMIEIGDDDEEIDVREQFLLNHFRERDGFESGLERILA
jgi:hypothetical protein